MSIVRLSVCFLRNMSYSICLKIYSDKNPAISIDKIKRGGECINTLTVYKLIHGILYYYRKLTHNKTRKGHH